MVAYLKAGPQVRTYSDYLRATREAEKEDTIELSWSPRVPATDGPSKPRATCFFPLRKLKGNQPYTKKPAVCLTQLEEEDADDGKDLESNDPNGIDGVTKEFMIRLVRVVKDAQADEKCCYHCSSPEHFIRNLSADEGGQGQETVKWEGGDSDGEGSLDPSKTSQCHQESPTGGSGGIESPSQTPFLNLDLFQ